MHNSCNSPILIWTHPRASGNAFEKALISGSDLELVHEPFAELANYSMFEKAGCSLGSRANLIETVQSQLFESDREVLAKILAKFAVRFVDETLAPERLKEAKHVLLINEPESSISSYYEKDQKIDFNRTGYPALKKVFEFLTKDIGLPVEVVLTRDFLTNPKKVLQELCDMIDLEYSDDMLTWEKGDLPGWNKWNQVFGDNSHWHDTVSESVGIIPPKDTDITSLPRSVKNIIDQCKGIYSYIKEFARFETNNS